MPRTAQTKIQKLPQNETIYATLYPNGKGKDTYYITARIDRLTYFLYRQDKDGVTRLGKAESPSTLEDKYIKYAEGTDTDHSDEYPDDIIVPPPAWSPSPEQQKKAREKKEEQETE